MPLTLAHPAAVIPIYRICGGVAPLSALVIGSMVPDFAYFLPAGISRGASHSPAALAWFCLPVGCLSYLVFHAMVKRPLLSLAPAAARRLGDRHSRSGLPDASGVAVALAVLGGAVTHLLWDSFTHAGAPTVEAFPLLQRELFAVGGYRVFVFKVLQHGSTALGLVAVAASLRSWRRTAQPTAGPTSELTARQRLVGIAILAGVPVGMGSTAFFERISLPLSVPAFQLAVGHGVKAAFTGAGMGMLAFGALWHWWRRGRNHRSAPAVQR